MGELDEKLNAILGNPQAMGQIMALAQSLGGQGEVGRTSEEVETPPPSPMGDGGNPLFGLGDLDPRLMQVGMRVLQEYQRGDDKKTALLTALRPFVKEERYEKLDRAIQIARLSRVIRVALEELGKEGDGHV